MCDQIVVVDSGSTDATLAILERLTAEGLPIELHQRLWPGYAAQKQFALEQCRGAWCLSMDADERLDAALAHHLPKLLEAPDDVVGWRVARRPYLLGYGYSPSRSRERSNLRLIRRGKGRYDLSAKVHEGIVPVGKVEVCRVGALLHFIPHGMEKQVQKENAYSSLKAQMLTEKDVARSPWRMVFTPPLYFLRLYFRNGLWRCGFPGFIQAMTGAVYSFMTEAKIYQARAVKRVPPEDEEF